jgi:hypothetical protein
MRIELLEEPALAFSSSTRSSSAQSAARRKASSTVARVVDSPRARFARSNRSSSISTVVRLIMRTHYQMSKYISLEGVAHG